MHLRLASLAFVLVAGLATAASGQPPQNPTVHLDGCDAGGGGRDISTLAAAFDPDSEEIRVGLDLCAPADDRTKYRLRLDHAYPLHTDADRNGDGLVDGLDECADTADTGMMLHRGDRTTGPGWVAVEGGTVRYRVATADLEPPPMVGDRVYLWANTHYRGVGDRAPTTESADGCTGPQLPAEVVALDLVAPIGVILNEVVYDGAGSDGDEVGFLLQSDDRATR